MENDIEIFVHGMITKNFDVSMGPVLSDKVYGNQYNVEIGEEVKKCFTEGLS